MAFPVGEGTRSVLSRRQISRTVMPRGPVGEDAPDYRGFGLVDLQVRRGGRGAGDAPVAVGGLPGDDLSGAGAEQLAAPVPFGDLRLLVLGDHALHLGEQRGLRVIGGQVGGVGEPHRDPEAGQLVQDEDLIGVGAGEPVRGQAPHQLEQAGLGGVAQRVEAGPVQPRAGLAVVDVLAGQLIPGGADMLAQRLQLGADRAALGLPLGGHPRVDGDLHRRPPRWRAGTAARRRRRAGTGSRRPAR